MIIQNRTVDCGWSLCRRPASEEADVVVVVVVIVAVVVVVVMCSVSDHVMSARKI